MAQKQIGVLFLALAWLASATAIPMMPFSPGLMGYGGMMGGMMGMPMAGASFKSGGTSFNEGNNVVMPVTQSPHCLVGTEAILDNAGNVLEGIHVVIRPTGLNNGQMQTDMYGGGLGGLGGLFGGLGFGHMGGMLGMSPAQSNQLEARIEVIKGGALADDYVFVCTEASAPGVMGTANHCLPSAQGPVMTGPVSQEQMGHGYGMGMAGLGKGLGGLGSGYGGLGGLGSGYGGFSSPLNMYGGGLMGNSMMGGHMMGGNMMGGNMMGANREQAFGILATMTVKPGANAFEIRGLGQLNSLDQLAGRGCSLCRDVVMGMDGRPMCAGAIDFCVTLGYSTDEVSFQEAVDVSPAIGVPIA